MRQAWKGLLLAVALGASAPAEAAPPPPYGGYGYSPSSGGVLRLEIGGAGFGTNDYGCSTYGYYQSCGWSPFTQSAFVLGAEYDLPLTRGYFASPNLTFGLRLIAAGNYYDYYGNTQAATYAEPTLDLTWKFRTASPFIEPRLEAGVGVYLGADVGVVARGGVGVSLLLGPSMSLGADLILELGALGGYAFSSVQVTVGPEFRF